MFVFETVYAFYYVISHPPGAYLQNVENVPPTSLAQSVIKAFSLNGG